MGTFFSVFLELGASISVLIDLGVSLFAKLSIGKFPKLGEPIKLKLFFIF
jgi:hypothetical protein